MFTSVDDVTARLAEAGYLASDAIATTVFLASGSASRCSSRARPASARPSSPRPSPRSAGARLVRLQCYEGVDEARALYEWNHAKQLLRITAGRDETWDEARTRHLQRGVPAPPPAADRDPQRRARPCC